MASAFIGWIISCMTGNAAFPKPPMPLVPPVPPDPTVPVDMTTRKASLDAAIAAAQDGGTVLTVAQKCRPAVRALMGWMRCVLCPDDGPL